MRAACAFGLVLVLACACEGRPARGLAVEPSGRPVAEHSEHGERPGAPTAAVEAGGGPEAPSYPDEVEQLLASVVAVHGGAGPWAVAGYRMGEHARRALRLERGSFDLEVRHESPREVQFSCIADGAAAATGASLGKLNLSHVEVPREAMRTVFRRRSTGAEVALRPTTAFAARFAGVPRERLAAEGRTVARLTDAEVFEVAP